MPVLINQPIKQATLMDHFDIVFGKYNNGIGVFTAEAKDERQEAEEDIQKQLLDELDDDIHENGLIRLVSDSDGTHLDTDNLMEWLSLYYTIEPK